MAQSRKLWFWLAATFFISFSILGLIGREIYVQAPPVPERVVANGRTIMSRIDIESGREVWQTLGGMELGSVWGHGSYVAPDWTADWLHREATTLLDTYAQERGARNFAALDEESRAALSERLRSEMRRNSYDPATGTITFSKERAAAVGQVGRHYAGLFGGDPALSALRVQYAIPENLVLKPEQLHQLAAFFFWTSWAATTQRPGSTITYTNNWPH